MALDRWLALFVALIFLLYGYTSFFQMDGLLPPILKRNPVWPSSFPKILAVIGVSVAILVLINIEKPNKKVDDELDLNRWRYYQWVDAFALIAGMIGYALTLRSLGFLTATFLFLSCSAVLLGERRFTLIIVVSAITSYGVWYLVNSVLGIYMTPYPRFILQ